MVQDISRDADVNSPNREELLQLAMQTAKQNPQGARVMFQKVLSEDPRNERALLWMAYLSRSKTDKRRFLIKTLKVNPENATAIKELQKMSHTEKARANRTLLYGGIVVVAVILLVVVVVLLGVAVS